MPFAVAGAVIPSVHKKNISREIVNNVNIDVVEDARTRLKISFPPASTTTSTEDNFEDEENNNGYNNFEVTDADDDDYEGGFGDDEEDKLDENDV